MVTIFGLMSKERRERYRKLREIRQERDYQMGTRQYANRPYSFRTARVKWKNGKAIPVYMTTKQFIKKYNLKI